MKLVNDRGEELVVTNHTWVTVAAALVAKAAELNVSERAWAESDFINKSFWVRYCAQEAEDMQQMVSFINR